MSYKMLRKGSGSKLSTPILHPRWRDRSLLIPRFPINRTTIRTHTNSKCSQRIQNRPSLRQCLQISYTFNVVRRLDSALLAIERRHKKRIFCRCSPFMKFLLRPIFHSFVVIGASEELVVHEHLCGSVVFLQNSCFIWGTENEECGGSVHCL